MNMIIKTRGTWHKMQHLDRLLTTDATSRTVADPQILVGGAFIKIIARFARDYFRSCFLNWNHAHNIIAANEIKTTERPENLTLSLQIVRFCSKTHGKPSFLGWMGVSELNCQAKCLIETWIILELRVMPSGILGTTPGSATAESTRPTQRFHSLPHTHTLTKLREPDTRCNILTGYWHRTQRQKHKTHSRLSLTVTCTHTLIKLGVVTYTPNWMNSVMTMINLVCFVQLLCYQFPHNYTGLHMYSTTAVEWWTSIQSR